MSYDYVLIGKLDFKLSIGECFKHHAFKLYNVILSQNNPSKLILS